MRLAFAGVGVIAVAACGTTVALPPAAQGPGGSGLSGSTTGTGLSAGSGGTTPVAGAPLPGSSGSAVAGARPTQPTQGTAASGSSNSPRSEGGEAIPKAGRGWDEKRAYIGVPWQDTGASQQTAGALGLKGLVGGDYRVIARAVIADINKRGGLFGRTVEPVFVEFPPLPNQTGQSQCTAWTQDQPVFAVSDDFYTADPLTACLARAKIPFNQATIGPMEDKVLARYGPYLHILHATSYTKLFPALLDRLASRHFLTGWGTAQGAPAPGPIKAGLYCRDDTEAGRNDCAFMERTLKARGVALAESFHVSGSSDQSSAAVLRFRSEGVTHVFGDTTDILFFMINAQNQRYYPRYGVTTYNAPTLLASTAPATQNRNAAGISFSTTIDVYPSVASGPGRVRCMQALRAAGVTVAAAASAEYQAQSICDQIYFFVDAAKAGGGMSPARVLAGEAALAGRFSSGSVFSFGISGTRRDGAAAVRDLGWVESCSCYGYLSRTDYPT